MKSDSYVYTVILKQEMIIRLCIPSNVCTFVLVSWLVFVFLMRTNVQMFKLTLHVSSNVMQTLEKKLITT